MSALPPPTPRHNAHPFAQPPQASRSAAAFGSVTPSSGFGVAIIVLLWVELAAILLSVAAAIYQQRVFSDIGGDALFERWAQDLLERAGDPYRTTALVALIVGLAAIILLALWSNRVSHNARNRGVTGLSPGLAAGGWFIPFAQAVIPFVQLRRAAKPFLGATTAITAWQVFMVSGALVSRLGAHDIEQASTSSSLSDALSQRVMYVSIAAVLFAVATTCATRAIKDIDRRVSKTVESGMPC